jgi:hypothetical protein
MIVIGVYENEHSIRNFVLLLFAGVFVCFVLFCFILRCSHQMLIAGRGGGGGGGFSAGGRGGYFVTLLFICFICFFGCTVCLLLFGFLFCIWFAFVWFLIV